MDYRTFVESLKDSEGFVDEVYKDTLGKETVGYGFLVKALSDDELAINAGRISPMGIKEANEILEMKLEKIISSIHLRFKWFDDLPSRVQFLVIEMCYQLGIEGFLGFKRFIKALKKKDYKTAKLELKDSLLAKRTPNRVNKYIRYLEDV